MKVGFLSDCLSSRAGGIFEIERCLALALRKLGAEVVAWGLHDDRWQEDAPLWKGIECRLRRRLGPRMLGYAPGLVDDLVASERDLLHLQHLWMYPSLAALRWHRRTGRPYLATPNGMLEPWTLGRSRLNKRLAALAYEDAMLRNAACIQANTTKELADIRAYGLRNPVCLVPNGVDLPELSPAPISRAAPDRNRPRTLIYLGRLHPKKGLAGALRAWAGLPDREGWRFVVAGWDQIDHGDELRRLCRELELPFGQIPAGESSAANGEPGHDPEADLVFLGPVFGAAKDALLRSADAFVLPSHSEGLPMAVLEAWAYGLPVLMTPACNLPEGFAAGAALEIGTDPGSIAEGLRALLAMPEPERLALGRAGRRLVEERFTWPRVASQMHEVYQWMLGGGPVPPCLDRTL